MSQKKPTPTPTLPFEQHSSSSSDDEEEEVSVEEEAEVEEVESESDSDSEEEDPKPDSSSEEDGSDEEEVTPVAPVKPVVVQSPKVRAKSTLAPATAPASAVTVGKKRPGEKADGIVSKKLKMVKDKRPGDERGAEDVVKKRFQRVFSEKDEIMLLNSLLEYSANKCIDPIEKIADFHDFVKKYIQVDVSSAQLSAKIKKMKSKYKKNASETRETFGKAHDQSCYDLSKKIWGRSSSACGGSELKTNRKEKRIPKTKNMTPGLQIPQVVEEPVPENISWTELAKTRDVVGMMCLSDDTFKKNLELLSNDEARAALEDKLKNIVTAEVELTYKRLELSRELMKSSLDASGHRG